MIYHVEARPEDFKQMTQVIKNEEELFFIYPSGEFPLTISQLNTLYKDRRDFTLLKYDKKIIGFANLYNYLENKFVFIGNVVIDTKYRNKGYGSKLIHYMISLAQNKYNLPEVRISVFSENAQALLLYINLGFELYDKELKKDKYNKNRALFHMKMRLNAKKQPQKNINL